MLEHVPHSKTNFDNLTFWGLRRYSYVLRELEGVDVGPKIKLGSGKLEIELPVLLGRCTSRNRRGVRERGGRGTQAPKDFVEPPEAVLVNSRLGTEF